MCGSSHGNLLRRLRVRLAGVGFADASFGFGFLMGATPGTGVVLLSILMAAWADTSTGAVTKSPASLLDR